MFIYVLECDLYKYYIGKTNDICRRFNEHLDNKGSEWTKLYKQLKIIEIKPFVNIFDEDAKTLEYMLKYGIDNVRGGSYCQKILSNEQISTVKSAIRNADGSCLNCGLPGHFSKYCKQGKEIKEVKEIKKDNKNKKMDRC